MISSESSQKIQKGTVLNCCKIFNEVNQFEAINDISIFLAMRC